MWQVATLLEPCVLGQIDMPNSHMQPHCLPTQPNGLFTQPHSAALCPNSANKHARQLIQQCCLPTQQTGLLNSHIRQHYLKPTTQSQAGQVPINPRAQPNTPSFPFFPSLASSPSFHPHQPKPVGRSPAAITCHTPQPHRLDSKLLCQSAERGVPCGGLAHKVTTPAAWPAPQLEPATSLEA